MAQCVVGGARNRVRIVSPSREEYSLSAGLGFECMNNQVEYEALLYGLEYLYEVGARDIKVYEDSKLVVQQVSGECQCLDGVLNRYRERCLEIIRMVRLTCWHSGHWDMRQLRACLASRNGRRRRRLGRASRPGRVRWFARLMYKSDRHHQEQWSVNWSWKRRRYRLIWM
jgi:ribonuclease HI